MGAPQPKYPFGLANGRRPGAHAPAGGTATMRGHANTVEKAAGFLERPEPVESASVASPPGKPDAQGRSGNASNRAAQDRPDPRDEALRRVHEQNAVLTQELFAARALLDLPDDRLAEMFDANARLQQELEVARAETARQAALAQEAQRWVDEWQFPELDQMPLTAGGPAKSLLEVVDGDAVPLPANSPIEVPDADLASNLTAALALAHVPAPPRPRSAQASAGYGVGAPAGLGRRASGEALTRMNITLTLGERSRLERIAEVEKIAASRVLGAYISDDQRGDHEQDQRRAMVPSVAPPPAPTKPIADACPEVALLMGAFKQLVDAALPPRSGAP